MLIMQSMDIRQKHFLFSALTPLTPGCEDLIAYAALG
jgi:hypothetical protein